MDVVIESIHINFIILDLSVSSLYIKVFICWSEKIINFSTKLCIFILTNHHYHQCAI